MGQICSSCNKNKQKIAPSPRCLFYSSKEGKKIFTDKEIDFIHVGLSLLIYGKNGGNVWIEEYEHYHSHGLWPSNQNKEANLPQIKQISIGAHQCYFISNTNELYTWGFNKEHQSEDINYYQPPALIDSLQNITNITCTNNYCLALCGSDKQTVSILINIWFKLYTQSVIIIPNNIMELIYIYQDTQNLYITGKSFSYFSALGDDTLDDEQIGNWWKMRQIGDRDEDIIKMASGYEHSILVTSKDNLYVFGENNILQSGGSDGDTKPRLINMAYRIKISDIKCGSSHTLILDDNGRPYAFGDNFHWQCGVGNVYEEDKVSKPKLIEYFLSNGLGVKGIECGSDHSYCKTMDGQHFLWGGNSKGQCFVDGVDKHRTTIHPIDSVIKKTFGDGVIESVHLGTEVTFIWFNRAENA